MSVLYIESTEADLSPGTAIGITRQVHDITNLDSRQGDFTYTFKLPLTAKNRALLGFPQDVNSASVIPYRRINAMYIDGGQQLSGFLVVNTSTKEYASCVFYSGNSDFFDLLGDKKLNDLDLSEYDTYWNITGLTPNTFTSKDNSSGVVWPIIEWGVDDVNYRTLPVDTRTVNPKTLRPALYVHSLMNKLAELTGYVFDGTFLASQKYLTEAVAVTIGEPKHSDSWNAGQTFSGTLNTPITTHLDPGQVGIVTYSLDDVLDPGNNYSSFYYRFPASGIYTADVSVDLLNTTGRPISALLELTYRDNSANNVTVLQAVTVNLPDTTANILFQTNIESIQGDDIYPVITFTNLSGVDDEDVESNVVFEVYDIQNTVIGYGNIFECTGNMPEISLKEFVKSLCQRYNLITYTDVVSKIVRFMQYSEIYYAEPTDWSLKLDVSDHEIEFHPEGFAQSNQFRWAEDSNNPPQYANGVLEVGDETLKKEVINIVQPYAASLDVVRLYGLNVVKIPLLEFDEISVSAGSAPAIAEPGQVVIENATPTVVKGLGFNQLITFKLTTVKPRIFYVDRTILPTGEGITYDDGTATASDDTTEEPLTHFWVTGYQYNMTFEVGNDLNVSTLMDNYRELKFALDKFKKITAPFKLSAVDALGYDFTAPIQLPYGIFYCNRIKDYRSGKLTNVELIRM